MAALALFNSFGIGVISIIILEAIITLVIYIHMQIYNQFSIFSLMIKDDEDSVLFPKGKKRNTLKKPIVRE